MTRTSAQPRSVPFRTLPEPETNKVAQIKMLALLLRMQDSSMHIYMQTEWLKTQLDKLFPPSFYSSLFAMLLRQGRVWDFRDIFTARLLADGDETIYLVHDVSGSHRPLQALLAIWETSSVDDQCLTALALLDILLAVSMDQKSYPEKFRIITEDAGAMATQLALSIIEKDPAAMKSRTFIRWMIDRVHDAIAEDQEEADNAVKHLRSQPGILIEFFHLALPNYIPVKSENPGWRLENAPSKYSGPVKAVLKTARKLGDYSMEAEALEGLTWLSKNPSKEFDELCTLLKVRQGDFKSYAHAMVFKYLISTTEAQKKQFRDELRELCFEPGLADCLSAHDIWTISMLLYSIEDEGGEAEKALNIALNSSRYISADLIEKLETKMPDMRSKRSRYIDQTSGSLTDRKEAELGINMVERERRDRNVVSFPDIAADRLVQKDTEPTVTKEVVDLNPPARVHTTRESLREESNRRNISCSDLDLWQLHSDEPRRHRRRKERSRERRLARDQDYRLERLEQLRKEIEALKLMQQISRETERAKGEPEDIRKTRGPGELEGLAVRKPETAMRHKEETAHEEVWRRERAERDAIEYYKREVSEKESREKQERVLLEQLRELRNEVQELRSEVKSERSDRHFHVEGQPPIPERLRRGSFFRYTRRRNPPRTIQVDHPSSTDAEHSNDGRLIEIDGHSSSRDNRPDSVTSDDDVRSLAAYVEEVDDDHETPSGRTRRVEMIRVDPQSEGETSTGSKGKNKSARNGFSGQEIVVHGLESTMIERRTALRPEHETEHNTFEGDHVGSPGKRLQLAHDAGSETNADDEAPSSASTTLIT